MYIFEEIILSLIIRYNHCKAGSCDARFEFLLLPFTFRLTCYF